MKRLSGRADQPILLALLLVVLYRLYLRLESVPV